MGLLQKLTDGDFKTPSEVHKNLHLKNSDANFIFFSDFLISNSIQRFASLEIVDSHYFITNSFNFDVQSIIESYSSLDFWNGLIKEDNKIYYYSIQKNNINPLLQFFSKSIKDSISSILIYRFSNKKLFLICFENEIDDYTKIQNEILKIEFSNNKKQLSKKINSNNLSYFSIDFLEFAQLIIKNESNSKLYSSVALTSAICNELSNRIFIYFSNEFTKLYKVSKSEIKIIMNNQIKDLSLLNFHLNQNLKDFYNNTEYNIKIKQIFNVKNEQCFFGNI